MTALVRLENIEVTVRDKMILSIPSLEVLKGEVLGVMGPNGAGKSTLLKTLALLDPPSQGKIHYQEEQISNKQAPLELRRKCAVALQQSLLLDTSVYQNVAIGLKLRKNKKSEINKKVAYWLDAFNITHLAKKNAHLLSGGEAQRVNLARAMVLEPEFLLLDEPFSALDFPTKLQLLKDFKQIMSQTGTTAVFISHDLMEIKYLTHRLAILMDGEIKQLAQTAAVLESPNEAATPFIGEWKALLQ